MDVATNHSAIFLNTWLAANRPVLQLILASGHSTMFAVKHAGVAHKKEPVDVLVGSVTTQRMKNKLKYATRNAVPNTVPGVHGQHAVKVAVAMESKLAQGSAIAMANWLKANVKVLKRKEKPAVFALVPRSSIPIGVYVTAIAATDTAPAQDPAQIWEHVLKLLIGVRLKLSGNRAHCSVINGSSQPQSLQTQEDAIRPTVSSFWNQCVKPVTEVPEPVVTLMKKAMEGLASNVAAKDVVGRFALLHSFQVTYPPIRDTASNYRFKDRIVRIVLPTK
ncbi:unnamed protein product [Clavelina lepadiformis]|uniref:Uncharacterized protein n=1 Tax=Clavelina lepadiformis TaxID=159417 RepID=A0ABP0G710_CLALP